MIFDWWRPAYDLYASRWRVLRKIILPLVKPGVIAGSILVFIPSLGAYVTPRVLGGGKNLMLGNLIELQFGQGRNWPLGAALSLTLLAIVMIALIFTCVRLKKTAVDMVIRRGAFVIKRMPGLPCLALACFFALYMPLAPLVVYSFNEGNNIALWEGISLRWYREAWDNELVQSAAIRSLVVATVASVIATVLATMVALARPAPDRIEDRPPFTPWSTSR